jgi:chromosome segregation ATPase
LRNWRQLNTISRPVGDAARGNATMSQMAYRADQLEGWLHQTIDHEKKEKEILRHDINDIKAKVDDALRERDNMSKERDEWRQRHSDAIEAEKKTRAQVEEVQQIVRERDRKIEDMAEQRAESERKLKENAELMVKSAGDFSGVIQDFSGMIIITLV